MSIPYRFNSRVVDRGCFPSGYSEDVIKNEPMFFNCDLNFAKENGGPITRGFIESLPADWKNCPVVLDSRVHMLMPGWFPCIPGFHHDDVPRGPTTNGQPDYENPAYLPEHLMGLVNGDVAPTRFALSVDGQLAEFEQPKDGEIVYQVWHRTVEEHLAQGRLEEYEAPSGVLLQFDWQSWHEGQRAKKAGWRWFVRVSRKTHRTDSISNEIRRQVQVYLDDPTKGW